MINDHPSIWAICKSPLQQDVKTLMPISMINDQCSMINDLCSLTSAHCSPHTQAHSLGYTLHFSLFTLHSSLFTLPCPLFKKVFQGDFFFQGDFLIEGGGGVVSGSVLFTEFESFLLVASL